MKILSGGYGERLERVVVLFRKLKVKSMGEYEWGESRSLCECTTSEETDHPSSR